MKIQIDLTPDEDKIVQTYKLMRGFLTKEESIKEIIKLNGPGILIEFNKYFEK